MNMLKKLSMITAGAAVVAFGNIGTNQANAVVIDFQNLETVNANINDVGDTYSEDGFTLTEVGSQSFAVFGTLENRYPGSTALFSNTIYGQITLQPTLGGVFDLTSIDLAALNGSGGSGVVTVNFTATKPDSTTVFQSFTTDIAPGLETFSFTGFTGLTSVSWTQDSPFHQFDNIVVNPGTTPVPFEFSPGLGILALGACGAVAQLKNQVQKRKFSGNMFSNN